MTDWLSANALAVRAVRFVLGVLLLALTVRGLKSGSVQLIVRPVSREGHALLYWAAIAISGAVGAALVMGAVHPSLRRF
jgi:uncharacterized membrane-anchored protein